MPKHLTYTVVDDLNIPCVQEKVSNVAFLLLNHHDVFPHCSCIRAFRKKNFIRSGHQQPAADVTQWTGIICSQASGLIHENNIS
jgi:hypothetical protein